MSPSSRDRLVRVEESQLNHASELGGSPWSAEDVRRLLDAWVWSKRRRQVLDTVGVEERGDDGRQYLGRLHALEETLEKESLAFIAAAAVAWGIPGREQGVTDHVIRTLKHLVADTDNVPRVAPSAATRPPADPPAPPDPEVSPQPLTVLRQWAGDNLIKAERAVIEALCDAGGEERIDVLGMMPGIQWDDATEGFKSARRRLDPKLQRINWRIFRHDNAAKLMNVPPPEAIAPPGTVYLSMPTGDHYTE